MTDAQFQHLLDRYGSDLSAWPATRRVAAERLLASDRAAVTAHEQAIRLEALLRAVSDASPAGEAAVDASVSRVASRINARTLPPQHQGWRWWPPELATFEFAPAWPRVAALAGIAALGFAVGLVAFGGNMAGSFAFTQAANADTEPGALVFDQESITGLRQ